MAYRFPFARNISDSNMRGQLLHLSCQNRCENETSLSTALSEYCKCDPICLFLGDCCYDYLIICDARNFSFDEVIEEQAKHFHRHAGQSSCNGLYVTEYNKLTTIRLVDSCPIDKNTDVYDAQCKQTHQSRSFANYVYIVAGGIPYLNIYCAACHGMMLKDIETVTGSTTVMCRTESTLPKYPSFHFYHNFTCESVKVDHLDKYTKLIKRTTGDCWSYIDSPMRYCTGGKYREECYAYKTANGCFFKAKNKACVACGRNLNSTINSPKTMSKRQRSSTQTSHINLFKFVKTYKYDGVCGKLHLSGKPWDRCLVKKCQDGFRLHDGRCISVNHSFSCLEPHENAFSDKYDVADLFRPALLVIIKHGFKSPMKGEPTYQMREAILTEAESCTEIQQKVYHDILKEINPHGTKCYMIYSTALSYQSIVGMLESGDIEKHLFPGSRLVKMAAINHDPAVGLNCSGGSGSYLLTHKVQNGINKMEFQSPESDRRVISNRDPMVVVKDVRTLKTTYHALFCRLGSYTDKCSVYSNHSYTIYENCPKYELTTLPSSWTSSMTLKGGERLRNADYIFSELGNVLVCADIYDEKYTNKFSERMGIAVSTCYSVSLLCLLATFLIHLRYPPLRTMPGLMLMNLIIALFLAQLIYVMNSFKVFTGNNIFCESMASTQHYFWLASFSWMLCLSLDIFRCFSASWSTVKTYMRTTYYKYMSAGWLLPITIPLTAVIMDNIGLASIGYDSTACWLSGTKSVLYLFALPVLTIVTINIVLFVASVYRLRVLLKNAAYVGRKEDNKQRLIQCIKLSSWMGISWLFGIIPNILDLEALWYIFAVANAFQGVHIFFAFGITGRARVLMTKGQQRREDTASVALSSSVPTVSENVVSNYD